MAGGRLELVAPSAKQTAYYKRAFAKKKYKRKNKQWAFNKGTGIRNQNKGLANKSNYITYKSGVNKGQGTTVLPQQLFTTLAYQDTVTLSMISNASDYHVFRMNSLFDTDFTATGHQPRGFDQLATVYRHYQVYAVVWDINFYTKDTTRECFAVGVQFGNHQTTTILGGASGLYRQMREGIGYASYFKLIDDQHPTANIRGKRLCRSVEGISKERYNEDEAYSAEVTTSPTKAPHMFVFCASIDGGTATANLYADVKLTFLTKFRNKYVLGES